MSAATAQIYEVIEVGIMHPEEIATEALYGLISDFHSCILFY